MGGKNKQAQRTKNNARPSSSGRSAELLVNNAAQSYSFSSSSEQKSLIMPIFSSKTEDLDTISTDFQLIIKKMNKKNSTTKIKALQEFSDLVKQIDVEVVKTVLPFWPRLFNSLAIDSDHKVRETVHKAHFVLVCKVKSALKPYLKEMIAPWFTSQYDAYPPAASAASSSFSAVVPDEIFDKVMFLYTQEILDYIHDILFIQTPETIGDPKHNTPEGAEAKYERSVISSLQGYSLYVNKSDVRGIKEAEELNKKIIGNKIFWTYAKHDLAVVRAAWFQVLTAIFQKAPFLLEGEEGNVTAATLGNINEADPSVLPYVWQNVLLTVTNVKEWWTKINIEKTMLPNLWKMLKEGGRGNAVVIYPNLLPLLPHLTQLVEVNSFYDNFFQNLRLGLKEKSVLNAKVETAAVSSTFVECLRFVIMKYETDEVLCEKLIESHLIPTLEWCILEEHSCYKNVFNQTASLTQYWRENTSKFNNYSRYLDYFWENMESFLQDLLTNIDSYENDKLNNTSRRQLEFFQAMKRIAKVKKTLKVSFDEAGTAEERTPSDAAEQSNPHLCIDIVIKRCEAYVQLINERKNRPLLEHLSALIQEFDSKEFVSRISERLDSGEKNPMIIFEKLLKEWLRFYALYSRCTIDLIFLIFKYLNDEDKTAVLSFVEKNTVEEQLGWCMEIALDPKYENDEVMQNWIKSDKVSEFFVDVVEKEIRSDSKLKFGALFRLAMIPNKHGDLRISQGAVSKMMEKLKPFLLNPLKHLETINTCANMASDIAEKVYTSKLLLSYGDDFLIALLTLSCNNRVDEEYLPSETYDRIQNAWSSAFACLSQLMSIDELEKPLNRVVILIQKTLEDNRNQRRLTEVIGTLCEAFRSIDPEKKDAILAKLFRHSAITEWRAALAKTCKIGGYLNGGMAFCYDELDLDYVVAMNDRNISKFFCHSLFMSRVLVKETETYPVKYPVDHTKAQLDFQMPSRSRLQWLAELLYDFQLAESFFEYFRWDKFSDGLEYLKIGMYSHLRAVVRRVADEGKKKITNEPEKQEDDSEEFELLEMMKTKCREEPWIWCRIALTFGDELGFTRLKMYEELVKNTTPEDKDMVVHATQVFRDCIDFDVLPHSFDDISRMIYLRCLSYRRQIDVQIAEVMAQLEIFRSDDVARFNCESLCSDWKSHQMILEAVRLFADLIENQFECLPRSYIDIILISLTEWLTRLTRFHKIKKGQAMIIAATNLHQKIIDKINNLKAENKNLALTKEWDDLFAESLQNSLVELWMLLAGDFKKSQPSSPVTMLPYVDCFLSVSSQLDHQILFRKSEDRTPKWSKLLAESCRLITNPVHPLQLAAHKTIIRLIPGLVEIDSLAINTNGPNEDGLVFEHFKDINETLQDVISTMLMGMKVGEDSCRVPMHSETYSHTLGYLLVWNVILAACEKASMELKYQYADWLRQEDIVNDLFNNLFRLMPKEILHSACILRGFQDSFFDLYLLKWDDLTDRSLDCLVCYIFTQFLSQLPALVRQWWTSTETRVSQIVERLTSNYISPQLCQRELASIGEKKFKNMTVKVRPASNEIIAVYTVDESKMELMIKLPKNYPLAGPEVVCDWQIGGTSHKQWLLQIKKCVLHQNGSILDGLSLWNNNLDKKFDGVEECYICFSVLHPGTYQLPKLSCQTCKKKFHSACLYKWFSTSNKSSCPICRNLF